MSGAGVQPASEAASAATAALPTPAEAGSASGTGLQLAGARHAPNWRVAIWAANWHRLGGETRPSDESETIRWVRRALAVAVPILAVNSIFTAFADNMPASHHVAALVAAPIFVAVWMVELSGVRWPRALLIAAIVVPNLWLTLIGHTETNLLFLPLMVGWVAYVGTPAEGLAALVVAFATITIGQLGIVAPNIGGIPWESWTEWAFSLVLTWFLGFSLRKQQRLVTELDHRGQELEHRGHELERRGQELEMLLTVSGSVASTLDMRQLLEAVFDALGRVLDYSDIAVLTLNESQDTLTIAAKRGPNLYTTREPQPPRYSMAELGSVWDRLSQDEPVVIADLRGGTPEAAVLRASLGEQILTAGNTFVRSLMLVPLVARGRIIGVLAVSNGLPTAFGDRETSLALGIARQAAVAMENARLHERAQQAAVIEERQRLSRELHDSVTQALYGISLYAEAAGRALTDGDIQPVANNLQEIRDTTQEALAEMRLLLFELRPPLLQERGLAAALRARLQGVETRAGLVTQFDCLSDERLSPDKEQELYRIAQEALNNVLKHAHAGRVDVRLAIADGDATLEILDDGVGFERSLTGGYGLGLRGMHERVERLGGTLRIDTAPGAGTHLRVDVPR